MPDTPVRLSFFGAAGTVTGSRYLLDTGEQRILVDCGLFQGYKQLRLRNWGPLPFDAREIDAVLLTHAHIDHSGFLPALTRRGFRGPIYCSAATFELCKILLPDSAHLQEEDARFANRHGFSKHKPALPLYTQVDAHACLQQFQIVPRDTQTTLGEGTRFTFQRAGHLLGACFVRIEARGISITFSGDLGRPNDLILQSPAPLPATDFLVCEATYGDRTHPSIDPEAELTECLAPALARDAVVVVPAFAIGRAQSLLLQISRLKRKNRLPDVPVFLDSPMAIDASVLYRRFMDEHQLSVSDCDDMCHAATFVNTSEQSKALSLRVGPMIIISASGMATGGRVIHHLKTFAGNPRNLILLTGFQAPGTRGASLISGASKLRIHGEDWPVRAEVRQLQSSSSHADADEIIAWLKQVPRTPHQTFITHGEPGASDSLRQRIERELGWSTTVPEYRETVELTR